MIYEGQLESVDLKHCCDGKGVLGFKKNTWGQFFFSQPVADPPTQPLVRTPLHDGKKPSALFYTCMLQ